VIFEFGDWTWRVTDVRLPKRVTCILTLVVPTPEITVQPQNVIIMEGNAAQFSVIATGGRNLAYQWRRNGQDIPGATYENYSLNQARADVAGTYDVVVRNSGGAITSAPATLTITNRPPPPPP